MTGKKVFFQIINIVTWSLMPASPNLLVQLKLFLNNNIFNFLKKKFATFGIFVVIRPAERSVK